MKIIRKFAEYVGYRLYYGGKFHEWRCPNGQCGFSVSEGYECCPYCGQRIKFREPPQAAENLCEESSETGIGKGEQHGHNKTRLLHK